jgi:F0F1-type ATP synthase epsilon subunit
MILKIIQPTQQKEYEVVWIEANTPDGNFVIQEGHAPTTLVLSAKSDLRYCFKTGKQEVLVIKENDAILSVTPHISTVLMR